MPNAIEPNGNDPDGVGPRGGQPPVQGPDGQEEGLRDSGLHFLSDLLLCAAGSGWLCVRIHVHQSVGNVNLAYLFALSQFVMAWRGSRWRIRGFLAFPWASLERFLAPC